MNFCTDEQYETFMQQAPKFERMLIESGIHLTKFWFSVTRREQRTRFAIRQIDPVRRWKLSPMDLESLDKWDAYSGAKEEMFARTDTKHAPWITVTQQRQEARSDQRHAGVPEPVRVRGQGRLGRLRPGSVDRAAGPGVLGRLRSRHKQGHPAECPGSRSVHYLTDPLIRPLMKYRPSAM